MPPEHPATPAVGVEQPIPADVVELVTPVGRDWDSVARLVLAGIADRMSMSVEELDDLQLAVERLLLETGPADEEVKILFELGPSGRVRLRVGPLRERAVETALRQGESGAGRIDLRRILGIVVDSFHVEDGPDGGVLVEIDKQGHGGGER